MSKFSKTREVEQPKWRVIPAEVAAAGLALLGGFAFCAYSLFPVSADGSSIPRQFTICNGAARVTCVVDGDTFWLDGIKIWVADIDAPEIGEPNCTLEKMLGEKAKLRLRKMLSRGSFELAVLKNRDEDKFGRKLRVIMRDGESLKDQLVTEGLARTWTGKCESWC